MTAPRGAVLYTPELLALAVALAGFPLTGDVPVRGEARSRVCGSRVEIGLALAPDGSIARVGARVTACAMGQAAAALFLRAARGREAGAIAAALAALERWLGGAPEAPDWPEIAMLAAARDHPARHAAILLPWKAAMAALSNPAVAD